MCYRCGKCGEVVPHITPRLVHVTYRSVPMIACFARTTSKDSKSYLMENTRKEIAHETPVCAECKARLDGKAIRQSKNGQVKPTVVHREGRLLPDSL